MQNNYLIQNTKVSRLKKYSIETINKKNYPIDSILFIFFKKTKELLLASIYFCYQVIFYFSEYKKTLLLKNLNRNHKVLILGNGQSQDYLSENNLKFLIKNNFHLIVVNHWNLNKKFKKIIPNYIVISDRKILEINEGNKFFLKKNKKLIKYLQLNKDITLICPFLHINLVSRHIDQSRIIGFCDTELRSFYSNVNPLLPRGYLSSTVYKAIAMALWFSYKEIYLLGLDNTYSRDLYSDKDNSILNLENHAGIKNSILDITNCYGSLADTLIEISYLFTDIKKFSKFKNIYNLDKYSLTNVFKKIPLSNKALRKIANRLIKSN
jgi:hypothetical protein